ncbi:MAG: NAD-dependent aldehyde dehydrogenase associated with FdhD [uncultured Caballeronia sp.]|nr:MAG: NAD-dependent aldehyde dehydrogenase associated with FdhD [uncultured Caballeronia sp.]
MALYDAPLLFGFEQESTENLSFIPLVVRFNLDRFGQRISLEQWRRLPHSYQELLARFPVEDDAAIEPNFDQALAEMLRTHADAKPETFTPDGDPIWAHTDVVPKTVIRQSSLCEIGSPSLGRWSELSRFQRYALAKLSRKSDVNHDFVPAMREFGLAD